MRYRLTVCGSYPGAIPFEWYAHSEANDEEAGERIAMKVAEEFDEKYPEKAPHTTSAEADE